MALKEINLGGNQVLVEVVDLEIEGEGAFEYTSQGEEPDRDLADRIEGLVGALSAPVQAVFQGSGAEEWSLELNFGFKGQTGVPFVAKGEATAAVKVTAKWKRRD